MVPIEVVLEFLSNCTFDKVSQHRDLAIAEDLASMQYENMEALIDYVKPYIKNKATFKIAIEDMPENPFYKPYFNHLP